MKNYYDVVVVGAGPAGSVAAMRAAEAGLDVLLIEKRQEIGVPVRCAEAVGADSTAHFIPLDERWINAHIDTYAIHNTVGDFVEVPPTEPTLVVDRKVFDYELAHRAARCGASVQVSARAVGLLHDNGTVTGVTINSIGRDWTVRCKLVIAADGTESQVARWAGLKTVPPMADYYVGIQFLLGNIASEIRPNVCEYHVGHSIAPGGYVWVFPKGDDTANVGLVMSADRSADISPQTYLERFVEQHFPGAAILSIVMGGIPATGALKKMVMGGLMAVGDAAHQADPLTAGGINLGMTGADMAMQVGVAAVRKNDVSEKSLREYEALWNDEFGAMHKALYSIRKILTRMPEERFNGLIKIASQLPLDSMSHAEIITRLLTSHPGLLLEARTLITTGLVLK